MRRFWALLAFPMLLSCVPPSHVDLLNVSGSDIEIVSITKNYTVADADSIEFRYHNILYSRWEDVDGDGMLDGIIQLRAGDKILEYVWTFIIGEDDPLKGYYEIGNIVTWMRMQVQPDYSILLIKPGDKRPVKLPYEQPPGWPLLPIDPEG